MVRPCIEVTREDNEGMQKSLARPPPKRVSRFVGGSIGPGHYKEGSVYAG